THTYTMDSVPARFFELPELTHTLGSFLTKRDVASLVRTCRLFKMIFEPWLYQDLTLSSSLKPGSRVDEWGILTAKYLGVFGSSRSVRALSRNAHHVRRLSCHLEEITYLFNCLLRHQERSTPASNSNSASDFATNQLASSGSQHPMFPYLIAGSSPSHPCTTWLTSRRTFGCYRHPRPDIAC
ncbi:MAG: hypothetical protein J3R72DRAFT_444927, partial [Linnemannia gamsii]